MFGNKRRRAVSNPPLNGTTANPNATHAAAQAFLKNSTSNASLSAAAAAAALRSRPTTPISVADVQTKRTVRRAGSTSSIGSSVAGSRGPPGAQLERRGSSGSMTERTFRDPSPVRSSPVPSAVDAPPVPAIPKDLQHTQSAVHRRAASLDAPAMRIVSPPAMASGRGSSLGPSAAYQGPGKSRRRTPSLSSVQEMGGIDRPASRGANPSRIFSPTNQNLIYDPNTRSFLPEAQILAIEQRIQNAANQPVKTKKKIAPPQGTGSHLAAGTVGGRPTGTAIDEMKSAASKQRPPELAANLPERTPVLVQQAVAQVRIPAPATTSSSLAPPVKKKKKRVMLSDSESDQGSYQPNSSDTDSDTSPTIFKTRAGRLLAKRPSVVREDKEREEQEDDTPPRSQAREGSSYRLETNLETRPISPSPLPRSIAGRVNGKATTSAPASSTEVIHDTCDATLATSRPRDSQPTASGGPSLATEDSARGGRKQSISPARTTHFATSPENLVVKHQPPQRATSPRKSAMKHSHSNSPRGPSPAPDYSEASTLSTTDDTIAPRRKINRVSFDDSSVVVGTAATPVTTDSPIVASPQTKRPWFSIGRGKKKDLSSVADDEEEIMQPRPALPSFGSVREKKPARETESERPLVKPTEPVDSKRFEPTSIGENINNPIGQSNDHMVGTILSQDATSKNEANISKSREPLPPQVTSVEGSGDQSESDSGVHDPDHKPNKELSRKGNIKKGHDVGHIDEHFASANPHGESEDVIIPTNERDTNVPVIAIQQPTPNLDTTNSRREWPDIPGAWGSHESLHSNSEEDLSHVKTVEHHATEPTVADIGISEPAPVVHKPGTPSVGEIAVQNAVPVIVEETESETDSIYSDAAEDLSDAEGDGFMSLDAVVDSPVSKNTLPGLAISTPPDSPTAMSTKERAYKRSGLSRNEDQPDTTEGWNEVQDYWSTLSAEKKHEMEQQAREKADGSDTETEVKPKPKPKKKKKVALQPVPTVVELPAQPRQATQVNQRQYMIQPGAKAGPNGHTPFTMKSSMRAEPQSAATEPHIRKSMRGPAPKGGSLRTASETAPELRGSLQKKFRPMSYPPPEIKADPAAVKMHVRALSAASARAAPAAAARDEAPPVPNLRRKGSGDSQSSFRRARPSSEVPNMRKSMRGSSEAETPQSPTRSSRFSLRSLSPAGSAFRRPFSSSGSQTTQPPLPTTHMKSSMRDVKTTTPTMRHTPPASRFDRASSNKPSKIKAKAAPKKASRFADSSDEEDALPSFSSRFVDSSDDDNDEKAPARFKPAPLRVPQRSNISDDDSSDLPDSDEEKSSLKIKNQNGTSNTTSAQGITLASGSLRRSGSGRETLGSVPISARPQHSRRGSFMSILRRKKDPGSKVRKVDIESAARRDTPLERSKSDLADLKMGEAPKSPTPKLVKRNTGGYGSRTNSTNLVPTLGRMDSSKNESWPLAPVPLTAGGEDGRPETADGVPVSKIAGTINEGRPDIGSRRFTATGLSGVDVGLGGLESTNSEAGRKKKKFGKLRKMFRLDE